MADDERVWQEAWLATSRAAFGEAPVNRAPATLLRTLLDRAPEHRDADRYGGGALAERLERRVGQLLGKEAAVWMPSGTMAQQIALRIYAERRHCDAVAFHPLCHLEAHEERGYQALHGLRAVLLGGSERLVEASDVAKLAEPVAAVLLELPQRDLGGRLPTWDDLVATCEAARRHGAALHLDGARLWQCGPFYARALDEIAALFDSVYVSFYKDLGAPAGCALAGPEDFVAEARVWQVRHGGRLFSAFPYLAAAEVGLDERLPQMPVLVERARAAGQALAELPDVTVVPDPPQTAMFHAVVRRPLDQLNAAVLAVARASGTWIANRFRATSDPDAQRCELSVTSANLAVPVEEVVDLWRQLLISALQGPDEEA
jgi:threonine aldolase